MSAPNVQSSFGKRLASLYQAAAEGCRRFAVRFGMLDKPMLSTRLPVPFALLFQLLFPVISFGFIFGPGRPTASQPNPALAIGIGLVSTAALFVLTRLVFPAFNLVLKQLGSGWAWLPLYLVLILAFLSCWFLLPAVVIRSTNYLFPAYVTVNGWGQALSGGMWVLIADNLLGTLCGVRLFLPASAEVADKVSDGK